jgi:hypothetical protein
VSFKRLEFFQLERTLFSSAKSPKYRAAHEANVMVFKAIIMHRFKIFLLLVANDVGTHGYPFQSYNGPLPAARATLNIFALLFFNSWFRQIQAQILAQHSTIPELHSEPDTEGKQGYPQEHEKQNEPARPETWQNPAQPEAQNGSS